MTYTLINNLFFFLGIIFAEILLPKEEKKLLEELLFIFLVVTISSLIFQKNFKLFGSVYYFSFFVGFVSTAFSEFVICSYKVLYRNLRHREIRRKINLLKIIRKNLKRELMKEGVRREDIDRILRRI